MTTTKKLPPAGTATHKQNCGCIQCKATRYDALNDKLGITQLQLRNTQDELKNAKDLQDRTADELDAALAEVEAMAGSLATTQKLELSLLAEKKQLTAERDALKTERDGYAADLKTMTTEANTQRAAARLVPVLGFLLLCTVLTGLAVYLGVGGAK